MPKNVSEIALGRSELTPARTVSQGSFYEALRFPPPLLTYQQERGYVGSELTSVPAGKADRKSTLPP